MPSQKKKTPAAGKKPFKVLTRKAIIGWLVVIFVACGWMFALGVLVGRDQAPIKYDINAIGKQLSKLKQRDSVTDSGAANKKSGGPKDKNQLDFYEALPENREDTRIPKIPKPAPEEPTAPAKMAKPSQAPAGEKQAQRENTSPQPKVAAVESGRYTIQASSVKNRPDADRLLSKLIKRGYPAYLLTSQIEGKGTWHRVRIGSYPTKDAAKRVLDELRQAGMKPILVLKK